MRIPDPSPRLLVRLHLAGMIVWVALMSIYAAWIGHFSAWDAARAEEASQEG